ncbi:MAG TPA: hypothetical protein DEG76_03985 [Pseudohongiella sp.]|nr:hypothetical protein [Pseudohongiella sp.]
MKTAAAAASVEAAQDAGPAGDPDIHSVPGRNAGEAVRLEGAKYPSNTKDRNAAEMPLTWQLKATLRY